MNTPCIARIQVSRNNTEKTKMQRLKTRRTIGKVLTSIFIAIIMIGLSYVILSPLIGIVSNSFMTINDYYNPVVYLIPIHPTMDNFTTAWEQLSCPASILYTLVYSAVIMLIQTFICSFVGYGFARFKFPGCNVLFALVILTFVVPVQTFMVPLYMQFRDFDFLGIFHLFTGGGIDLLNTPVPIILLSLTGSGLRSGLFIYIFRQFFRGLPQEIESAAFIDGAGPLYTFFVIMLPNAGSAIITVLLFSFVWQYNDVFYASLFMNSSNLLPLQISTLSSKVSDVLSIKDPNQAALYVHAGITLTIIPLIVIYLCLQRHFMESVDRSGIVG
jgi:multiple sugar transport system permease protein